MHIFSIHLGTPETMSVLRSKLGVKIGSTTGYTTEIMAKLRVFRFIIIFLMDHGLFSKYQ